MTFSRVSLLVSTHWLREQIWCTTRQATKVNQNVRVLDTSWMPEPEVDGYKKFYKEAHIPTASHFDLKKVSPPREDLKQKFPIPDSNFFQDYVENLGISNSTHVVAYDRFNTRPSFRTWFLFRLFGHDRVSVLNGGLRQWIRDGYYVSVTEPEFERGSFTPKLRPELLRDYKAILANVNTKAEQLMDARGKKSFDDEDEDSPGGHIPGAKNIPFGSLFNEDGTVKSKEELKNLFDSAGVDLSKPLVSSCLTGMTACGLIAASYILGKEDVPLYNGSFHEWTALADPSLIVRAKEN